MRSFKFYVTDESTNRTIILTLEKNEDNNYVVSCDSYNRYDFNYHEIQKRNFKDYDDAWLFYIAQIEILTL